MSCRHVIVNSDTRAGVTLPKRSRRGQRAASPVAASSPPPVLAKEGNVMLNTYETCKMSCRHVIVNFRHTCWSHCNEFDPDPVCDWWIQALGLYQDDKTALLSQGELTENIINAVHTLLSLQFPHIAGLHDTLQGHHLDYMPLSSDVSCVQILHTG